jgi:hypothetical protein
MSNNDNSALTRATSGKVRRNLWTRPDLESPAGALDAARNGWWGGAWLALSCVIDIALSFNRYQEDTSLLYIALGIDGVLFLIGVAMAWVIRTYHPLWAIIVILVLLSLNLIVAVASLSIGFGLVINGLLIWTEINAIRGSRRLAAFRRGHLSPAQVGKVFE